MMIELNEAVESACSVMTRSALEIEAISLAFQATGNAAIAKQLGDMATRLFRGEGSLHKAMGDAVGNYCNESFREFEKIGEAVGYANSSHSGEKK